MTRYQRWLLAILGLMVGASAMGQPTGSLTARVDKEQVTVGEPFTLTLTLTTAPGVVVKEPGEKAKFKGLEVRGYQASEPAVTGAEQQVSWQYTLVSFEVGPTEIKDFAVTVTGTEGKEGQLVASPVTVEVVSVLPATGEAEPKGYYGPVMAGGRWVDWLWWVLLAVAAIALSAWGWQRWRRRRSETTAASPEVVHGPDETALTALQRLAAEGLIDRGEMLEVYLRLGEIMRAWLQARLKYPVMGRTTRGVMYTLRARRQADSWRSDYLELLKRADSVKFARVLPAAGEATGDLELAAEVIRRSQSTFITQPLELAAAEQPSLSTNTPPAVSPTAPPQGQPPLPPPPPLSPPPPSSQSSPPHPRWRPRS